MTNASGSLASTADYDPFMAEIAESDPYPLYEQLRAQCPRLFIERYNAWFFFKFEDVWSLSKRSELSVAGGITPTQLLLGSGPNPLMVSQMDPPDHRLFRSALNPLFTVSAARSLEDVIREDARALLKPLLKDGGGDLLMDYSGPLAVGAGCWLSGLPREDRPLLMRWTNQFFHRRPEKPGDTEVGAQAGGEFIAYIADHVAAVRAGRVAPHGGLEVLLNLQRHDPSVTDDHILFIVLNLQIGAGDTVPKSISATFHRLWEYPTERAKVGDLALCLPAFLEGVRIDMPTQMQGRIATTDFEHDGLTVEAGQKTMFLFASANRDPAEFAAPDAFQVMRNNRRTLGFGNGIHRCLGVHVAELEGRVALQEAMATIPNYAIDLAASRKHKTEYVKGWANLIATF